MYRYYLFVMFGGTAVIFAVAVLIGDFAVPFALLGAFGSALAVFALDALVAILIRRIPEEKLNPFSPRFAVRPFERRFFLKIGIRHWKDRIPESGALLCHFSKKKVADLHDNAYLLKFMRETCYAELMHAISIPAGFLVLFLFPHQILFFGLPVAVVNGILQLLPVFVQRYVRPSLISLYRRNERYKDRPEPPAEATTAV